MSDANDGLNGRANRHYADQPDAEQARWVPPPPVRRTRPAPDGGPPRWQPPPPGTVMAAPARQPRPVGTRSTGSGGPGAPGWRPPVTGPDWTSRGRIVIDERDPDLADPPRLRHRSRRGQIRMVEIFRGPRLRSRTGWWRRTRSIVFLIVVTVFVSLIVAAVLAGIVGGISYGISHAINNG